jgi:transcription elongation GreA/GreB family factor
MDKQDLLRQLSSQIRRTAAGASEAAGEAADDARAAADPTDRQSDCGSAVELARMARAQDQRRRRALAELDALASFNPRPLSEKAAVSVGAIVEIEDEESGEGRTFFLAPAGAGATLQGPGGDGHLTVVTPSSPVGRAVLGRRVGDVVDVTLQGEVREWTVTWVG